VSDGAGVTVAGPAVVGQFLATFKRHPPSQRVSSFSIDELVEKDAGELSSHAQQLTCAGRLP
jgi:arylsulfatase